MTKLPYCYPLIDTYSGVAGNVAALMVNKKNIPLVIANHFLISFHELLDAPGFNWAYYNDDFKYVYDMSNEIENNNIIINIKRAIDEGFYVQLYLDHYYITDASSFGKEHMLHDFATIFGYDSEQDIFFVGDNFVKGKYCIFELDKMQILNARKRENLPIEKFKIKEDYLFSMTLCKLCNLLKCYVMGNVYKNTGHINVRNKHFLEEENVAYGINYYDVLYKKLDANAFDPRLFHILINHMEIYSLFTYIFEESGINYDRNHYKQVVENIVGDATILRNIYLKYQYSHTEKLRISLINKIGQVKSKELEIISNLLKIMNLIDKFL